MLDGSDLDGVPLPTKLEMGLVANSSLKLAAQVNSGPNSQQEGPSDDPDVRLLKGSHFEGVLRDSQEMQGSTEWMGAQDGQKDREGMSLAHKRQLTIGASWAAPVRSSAPYIFLKF